VRFDRHLTGDGTSSEEDYSLAGAKNLPMPVGIRPGFTSLV
jgi:hypothetical protein